MVGKLAELLCQIIGSVLLVESAVQQMEPGLVNDQLARQVHQLLQTLHLDADGLRFGFVSGRWRRFGYFRELQAPRLRMGWSHVFTGTRRIVKHFFYVYTINIHNG